MQCVTSAMQLGWVQLVGQARRRLVEALEEVIEVGPLIDTNIRELLSDLLFEVLHNGFHMEADERA